MRLCAIFFVSAVVGVYVNRDGQRSRKQELLWHSTPVSFGTYIGDSCVNVVVNSVLDSVIKGSSVYSVVVYPYIVAYVYVH